MTLRLSKHLFVRKTRSWEGVRPPKKDLRCQKVIVIGLATLLFSQTAPYSLFAQQKRMVIDGSVRAEGIASPANAKIRILHQDGSLARTISLYDPHNLKFGVRLSSQDGFAENEKIFFRVVVSPQDSFVARFVGPSLVFHGADVSPATQANYVLLFRNSLPTIYRSLSDTAVNEEQTLRYRVVAIDRDADTVRFGLRNAPAGASIDLITGMFSWKPTYDQSGNYRVTFLISDGYETDSSHAARIRVNNVNRPPRFLNGPVDATIREADTLNTSILAVDPDGDTVSYRPLVVPGGMEIDSSSGGIKWIPTYDQAGRYAERFIAGDGTVFDTSQTAWITVLNVNRPPVFVSGLRDTVIDENEDLAYAFVAIDPDGDSVWYSLRNGPAGVTVSPTGFLNWNPTFTQAGKYAIVVSAHDQAAVTDTEVNIRVLNVDRPPGPNVLLKPTQRDTIRLTLSKPVQFEWTRSFDPDSDDTIRYRVHLWGPQLDTTMGSQMDTVLYLNIKPHLVPLSNYHWTVVANDGHLSVVSADTFSFRTSAGIVGSTEFLSQIPRTYYLEQSLPDPFNPMTTIRYALPERSYVKLAIFNMLGEPLLVLVAADKEAGVYDVTFDASEFTSGAYMFRLDAHPLSGNQFKDFVNTKKMFIVR